MKLAEYLRLNHPNLIKGVSGSTDDMAMHVIRELSKRPDMSAFVKEDDDGPHVEVVDRTGGKRRIGVEG